MSRKKIANHHKPLVQNNSKTEIHQQWIAPIPPPQAMAHYEQIVTGSANRIIIMAEESRSHIHNMQKAALRSLVIFQTIGQIFGFSIALAGIYSSYFLAMAGHDLISGCALLGSVSTIVLAFLQTKKSSEN